jgi:hypothetical protein
VSGVIAAGDLLIVGQFDLDLLKILGLNDGRNGGNWNPFFYWNLDLASSLLTNGADC